MNEPTEAIAEVGELIVPAGEERSYIIKNLNCPVYASGRSSLAYTGQWTLVRQGTMELRDSGKAPSEERSDERGVKSL